MDITVVGSINFDMICRVKSLPQKGETLLAEAYSTAFGGKGANQAVAAARLGADVAMVGAVGGDEHGTRLLENLRHNGIAVESVLTVDGPSGIAMIAIDSRGDNTILVYPGANGTISPERVSACSALFDQSSCLMLQLEIPMESVLFSAEAAWRAGARVILNPAPAAPIPDELFRYCSLITPNETELAVLSGKDDYRQGARELLQRGAGAVAVTLGGEGCYYLDAGQELTVPAFSVAAVDATAAGDTFNGALAVMLTEGRPLQEALAFANAAGALSVQKLGAQPSVPTRSEVEAFLEKNKKKDT